jgi:hypothetical protein
VARGAERDYRTPRLKLNDIYLLLEGLGDRTINGVSYLWFGAVQEPFPMGLDENGRMRMAVNFDITKARSTA